MQVTVECETDIEIVGNIREHDVAEIGIDTTSSRFTTVIFYSMRADIVEIDFVFHQLVSSENDRGIDLPHEKAIFTGPIMGYVFLHSQIERQTAYGLIR